MIDLAQAADRGNTVKRRQHRLDNHYEQILAQLRGQGTNDIQPPRGIGVMGLSRGSGATSIASNIATMAAESGTASVLLIDANSARPALHKIFRVPSAPGFREAIAGTTVATECVHSTSLPGLSVMPAGGVGRGAAASLPPTSQGKPFDDLYSAFGLVIVDLPAASDSGIGFALAKSLDGIVLVLEAERSRRSAALRIKRQLDNLGANILGVVLNKRRLHVPNWLYRAL